MGNLQYEPMKVCDLRHFVQLNPTIHISLTVMCIEEERKEGPETGKHLIIPLYCTREKIENHVTLLILSDEGRKNHVLVHDIHAYLATHTRKVHRRFYCRD